MIAADEATDVTWLRWALIAAVMLGVAVLGRCESEPYPYEAMDGRTEQ